ncbi:MAG: hypothetical protein ACJ8M1_05850 [Chthoniobacterales bacterium]
MKAEAAVRKADQRGIGLRDYEATLAWPVLFVIFSREFISVRLVLALVCASLFASLSTSTAAGGTYQKTKDGKTLVWNQNPKPGDAATWSGDRDGDGYAAGFGTLTWHTVNGRADSSEIVYGSFFGNMIRGKLDGPVNGHSRGVTNHALFNDGKRTTRWAAGPVSSWRTFRGNEENQSNQVIVAKVEQTNRGDFNPPPPTFERNAAERPVPDYNSVHVAPEPARRDIPAEGPDRADTQPSTQAPSVDPAAAKPKLEMDDSLRSLVAPPPSLVDPAAPAGNASGSDPGGARLSKEEVTAIADAAARKKGYELKQYHRSEPQFDQIDSTWAAVYEPAPAQTGKRFTVAIDDRSKRTAIVGAR